ncbi:MAG: aldehyde ferredoxin oxidoreductase family protein [Syntrophomonas sp.]
MYGWIGQLLRVNLTNGKITKEPLDPIDARDYIGTRGLGTRIWIRECDATIDPLSPENKMIMMTGPLTGTLAVSSSRYEVVCKGPLTGTIAASNSGGYFGSELKYAGYDGIIFEGQSEKPVYLWINDDEVELRSAEHLWGKGCHETTELLLAETNPKARVNCIGQAGENLVKFAAIMNDFARAAARTGVGTVMGSKKLKAVAVRGTKGIKIADPKGFKETMDKINSVLRANPSTGCCGGLHVFGSNVTYAFLDDAGVLPVNNFRDTGIDCNADNLTGEAQTNDWLVRAKGCMGCPIRCGRITRATGKFASYAEGPELETIWCFGSDCGIDNMKIPMAAGHLCNDYGLDTITMGSTIAAAMDMYEAEIIDKEITGWDLRFGNEDAVVDLVIKTALREGFGNDLAEGSYRLCEKYGHPELSMTVKKQELSAYDPRGLQSMGLSYATTNRGACHVRAFMPALEIYGLPVQVDRLATEGKAAWVKIYQDNAGAVDASGSCCFVTFGITTKEIAEELTAVTGVQYSEEDFIKAGERIWNMERLFNLKNGFTREDDKLPPRLLKDPIKAGPSKGHVNRLNEMLDEYYTLRGWDENGVPSQSKIEELNISDLEL